ncbi:hypothetical protein CDD82_3329 [Ophiocordyceps australis]|uniref:RGS domain-containing protein n=1 Tax=Ophiocordyceps australis TaxID=1399860 RepID=A0A2C5ZUN3_9HYPO|nr:hypothetical protein CDD82_3329 [Ophiocordyceps australis]
MLGLKKPVLLHPKPHCDTLGDQLSPVEQKPRPRSDVSRLAMSVKSPTLTEILLDTSPPPWTLTAFMAYLSQNHCMESLEFTLDSQRYAAFYNQCNSEDPGFDQTSKQVCAWWNKLMQIYVVPCAVHEINIPSRVRDYLLNLRCGPSPPHPSELQEATSIVFELMNDSLLVPFLQSVAPLPLASPTNEKDCSRRPLSYHDGSSKFSRHGVRHSCDTDGPADDSDSSSPTELMTPPTTPPSCEYTFATSPGGLQRAVAAHSKGWKKMGAKLGLGRKGHNRRSTPTSSSLECDAPKPHSYGT